MEQINLSSPNRGPLSGVRIWLSGSVPEENNSSETERKSIAEFVSKFSERIFSLGGSIIHGSHPSFREILLDNVRKHRTNGGKRDSLILAVSRYWSKNPTFAPVDEWRNYCVVYETPEDTGANAEDESLKILRNWMAARCDAIVVVGGKFWREVAGKAGVPIEVDLAVERKLACFLLGGPGGVAKKYFEDHPELLKKLKNGFDDETNFSLATDEIVENLVTEICEQLTRLPLVHGPGSESTSFRVLALDGGGIKGAFTAAVLATWEEQTGLKIVDHFDLIAGTSTGGILAIGLGLGLSAKQMLGFYREKGPIIFPITSLRRKIQHGIRHFFKPKFSQETLLREIKSAYYKDGNPILLKASKCRLVIPAYHALAGASHVFRTPHNKLLTGDANMEVAHVALATASAPTYFSAAKVGNLISESSYFDGGVWANSPAMTAIIETTCFLNIPLDRIDVLSIGTTDEPFTVKKQIKSGILPWGFWNKKLVGLLMNAQEESSQKYAKLLAGEPRFLRVNETTPNDSYTLDSPNEIEELAALGNRAALKTEILTQVSSRFLNGVHVVPWESYQEQSNKKVRPDPFV